MLWDEPRSTWSHWGSENALDQRVPVFPSTAFAAGVPAFSVEDAVAVLFRARLVVPQLPPPPPPPLPVGSVQCCCAEPVQVSMSSRAPVLPPGSVRQRPELGLTSSPFDWWVQVWAAVPLQGYQSTLVPLEVPALTTSRQPPWVRSVPSEYGDHCWPAVPLQELTPIGLPEVFSEFWLARHRLLSPVTGPVAVAVAVGVELPPCSYTAT